MRPLALAVALIVLAACQLPSQPGLEPLEQPSSLQAAEPRVSGTIPIDRSRQRAFEARGVATAPVVHHRRSGPVTDRPSRRCHAQFCRHRHSRDRPHHPRHHAEAELHDRPQRARHRVDRDRHAAAAFGIAADARNLAQRRTVRRWSKGTGSTPWFRLPAGATRNLVSGANAIGAGTQVVPLRYASAKDLAKVLEPYVAEGGKISRRPGAQRADRLRGRRGPPDPGRSHPRFRHRHPGRSILRPLSGGRRRSGKARERARAGVAGARRRRARRHRARHSDGSGQCRSRGLVAAALHRCGKTIFQAHEPGRGCDRAHLARLLRAERSERRSRKPAAARVHAAQRLPDGRPAGRHRARRRAADDRRGARSGWRHDGFRWRRAPRQASGGAGGGAGGTTGLAGAAGGAGGRRAAWVPGFRSAPRRPRPRRPPPSRCRPRPGPAVRRPKTACASSPTGATMRC